MTDQELDRALASALDVSSGRLPGRVRVRVAGGPSVFWWRVRLARGLPPRRDCCIGDV